MTTPEAKAREDADARVAVLRQKPYHDGVCGHVFTDREAAEKWLAWVRGDDWTIEPFLTTALEGADERIVEIRQIAKRLSRPIETPNMGEAFGAIATKNNAAMAERLYYLLTLVAALSAKLKEVEANWDRDTTVAADMIGGLQSQLTAQKAAHAKMLKAVQEFLECWDWAETANKGTSPPITAEHIAHGQKIVPEAVEGLRRLADKIEGGE